MIQTQFINYILTNKDSSIIELNNLNSDYFSEYSGEFSFILNHLEKYHVIPDVETFLNVFPDFELVEVHEPQSYLLEELFRDYQTRQMANTFNTIRPLLISGQTDKAMQIYKDSTESLNTGIALSCVDIVQDTSRYDAYLERTQNFDRFYISTGFTELDNLIGGIDREEELGVIYARTNLGKSQLAIKMAVNAAMQGFNVGFYSGEMSEKKVGYRADTFLAHISNTSLTHGNVTIKDKYKKYIDELPKKCPGKLKVLTPKMINGSAGVNALRMFIEKEHLDILFIDQLSLLEDDRKAKVPFERASNISKDLKNLQVMKRIPIISVCQQNRTKGDGEDDDTLDTTQMAMSDRIAQDATIILGITRDKKDPSIMKLHLVKSRDSANGQKLTYLVDFDKGTWSYVPDEKKDTNKGSEDTKKLETKYSVKQEPIKTEPTYIVDEEVF